MKYLILAIPFLFAACSKNPRKNMVEPPPVPVHTEEVTIADVPLFFEAMGTITPSQIAEVKPQIGGLLREIHFKEGEWVEQGELLYTIDPASYEIQVKEAEALLAQEVVNLLSAKKKLERYKSLSKQDLISRVDWDELEAQVAAQEAGVQAGEAKLAAAKLNLNYCQVTAPIAGRTGKSQLDVGNMVSTGDPLVTLTQDKELFVEFSLTEKELQKLRSANPPVALFAAGQEERLATGKVTFLDHNIDPKSGLLAAKAALTKQSKPLFGGQAVRVHLYFGKKKQATLIPLKAIKTNQAGPYIFAVQEGQTVALRNIKLGQEQKGMIVVEEGLEGASRVVTEGQGRLYAGSKIEEAVR